MNGNAWHQERESLQPVAKHHVCPKEGLEGQTQMQRPRQIYGRGAILKALAATTTTKD